jgi:hypothetical protein
MADAARENRAGYREKNREKFVYGSKPQRPFWDFR